jgi:hypothetical protein
MQRSKRDVADCPPLVKLRKKSLTNPFSWVAIEDNWEIDRQQQYFIGCFVKIF